MNKAGPEEDTNMRQTVNSHHINSDRAAMKASERDSPTALHQNNAANVHTSDAPANRIPLTSEEAAARKVRMNADLIDAFKSPCLPGTTPYVTGIGLYTHIEGPPRAPLHPDEKPQPQQEFLPIRKPKNSGSRASQPDELVEKLLAQLERAVEEEEGIIGKTELGPKELKKRYGGLDPPKNSRPPVPYVQQQPDRQACTKTDAGTMKAPANGRGQSIASVLASLAAGNQDTDMGGSEVERGKLHTPSSTTAFYGPDPRRQGR